MTFNYCVFPCIISLLKTVDVLQIALMLLGVAAVALARPADIVDFETDTMDVEQEVLNKSEIKIVNKVKV